MADSGYGQGQILVNPLHMACIYSAFCNEGNMIKPYLTYKEDAIPNVWITAAFTKDAAQMVLEDTKEVHKQSHGTGYAACRTDITLAGKTGTAEIKASKEDTTGTELGWFSVFTTDENMDRPIMIISMVEDVKGTEVEVVMLSKKIVRFLKSGCLIISIGFLMEISGM